MSPTTVCLSVYLPAFIHHLLANPSSLHTIAIPPPYIYLSIYWSIHFPVIYRSLTSIFKALYSAARDEGRYNLPFIYLSSLLLFCFPHPLGLIWIISMHVLQKIHTWLETKGHSPPHFDSRDLSEVSVCALWVPRKTCPVTEHFYRAQD